MNCVIYKYPLSWTGTQVVSGVLRPLCIAMQKDNLCLWAEAPHGKSDDSGGKIQIVRLGTGFLKTDDSLIYLNTVHTDGFVWHFYYKYV